MMSTAVPSAANTARRPRGGGAPPPSPSPSPDHSIASSSSTSSGGVPPHHRAFPLPDKYFPEVSLSPVEVHAYEAQAIKLIHKALQEAERLEALGPAGTYKAPWEQVAASEGVTAVRLRNDASSNSSDRAQYRVFGRINGDYRHMMELHYAETSDELFEWHQFTHQHTLDARVLETYQTATIDNVHHYMGLKWLASHPVFFTSKADALFVEYMTYTKDLRGRDVGARVSIPVFLPEMDEWTESLKLKRMSSQIVQIVRAADLSAAAVKQQHEQQSVHSRATATQLFAIIEHDTHLFSPPAFHKRIVQLCQNMALCIDSKRIAHRGLLEPARWVANHARKSCVVCTRAFNATRGRHHCRLCGDVICRKCTLVRDTADYAHGGPHASVRRNPDGSTRVFRAVKNKFCVLCIARLRDNEFSLTASSIYTQEKSYSDAEYAPTDYDDDRTRQSLWSETESEDCRTEISFGGDGRSSVSSLTGLEADMSLLSARLLAIPDQVDEPTDGRGFGGEVDIDYIQAYEPEPVPEERLSAGKMDIAEFIDTKDMIPESQLHQHPHQSHFHPRPPSYPASSSTCSSSSSSPYEDGFQRISDRRGSNPFETSYCGVNGTTSHRSIGQCLAEQEELLRRMVLAASTHQQQQQQQHFHSPPHGRPGAAMRRDEDTYDL